MFPQQPTALTQQPFEEVAMPTDLTNKRFGHLVVLRYVGVQKQRKQWLCLCDCGRKTTLSSTQLRLGRTTSCGCFRKQWPLTHGHTANGKWSPTYRTWKAMMTRCHNPSSPQYFKYGGSGIVVCKRWHKFENFLADMGERPAGKTIDRYPNPSGIYKPSNCRWATPKQQRHNRLDYIARHGVTT